MHPPGLRESRVRQHGIAARMQARRRRQADITAKVAERRLRDDDHEDNMTRMQRVNNYK